MKTILSYSPEKSREILKHRLKILNIIGMVALVMCIFLWHDKDYAVGHILDIVSKLTLAGVAVGYMCQLSMENRRKASTLYYSENCLTYITIKEGTLLYLSPSVYRIYRIKKIDYAIQKRNEIVIYGKIGITDTSNDSVKEKYSGFTHISIPRCYSDLETLIGKYEL